VYYSGQLCQFEGKNGGDFRSITTSIDKAMRSKFIPALYTEGMKHVHSMRNEIIMHQDHIYAAGGGVLFVAGLLEIFAAVQGAGSAFYAIALSSFALGILFTDRSEQLRRV
jgi:hypothetical protein